MTTRRLPRPLTALLGLALLLVPASADAAGPRVLGADDSVYTLISGTEAEIFSGDSQASESHVLALGVKHADGSAERLLVPGTESDDLENNSILFSDPVSGAVFVLWESSYDSFSPYSRLLLTSYRSGTWSDPILLSLSSFIEQSSAQLAITRDEIRVDGPEGEETSVHRTVLHLAWIEDYGTGSGGVVYSPVFLVGDEFDHLSRPVSLEKLFLDREAAEAPNRLREGLLTIHTGEDMQSVVVAGGAGGADRLFAVEIQVLPGEVGLMADGFRDLVLAQAGSDKATPQELAGLQSLAFEYLDAAGQRLSASFVELAKQEIADVFATGGESLAVLAAHGRQRLIDLAGRLQQDGVQKVTGPIRHQLVDVGARATPRHATGGGVRSHLVEVRSVSDKAVPQLLVERPASLLNSRDGDGLVVHWQQESKLWYQQSVAGGEWSEATPIELSEELDAEAAIRLLQERLDSH